MYKVTGRESDMFRVLDLDEGTEELLSAEQLVLALGVAEIEGCRHSENGIEVWYDGVEKYEIPIEVWAPVKSSYNRLFSDGIWQYEVSNFGSVRSTHLVHAYGFRLLTDKRVLKMKDSDGYCSVTLSSVALGRKTHIVHKLVADVFVFNVRNLSEINHIDECKSNNAAYNLEWCTRIENLNHGTRRERIAATLSKPVRRYSVDGDVLDEFLSTVSAGEILGFSYTGIYRCCKRSLITYKGFVFRYIIDDEFFGTDKSAVSEFIKSHRNHSTRIRYVRQYALDGTLVADGMSGREACKRVGSSNILLCCKRVFKTVGGYIWRYEDDDELFNLTEQERVEAVAEQFDIRPQIRQYTLAGLFVQEHQSARSAATFIGTHCNRILDCCKRRCGRRSASGFLWRYSDDDEFADRPENAKAIEEFRKSKAIQSE